jgi:hypothetical protein
MTNPDPAVPPPVTSRERYRCPLLIVIAAAIGIVAYQSLGFFVLPACDSAMVADALRNGLGGEGAVESLARVELSDTAAGRLCLGTAVTGEGTTRVEFLIAWDGWQPVVHPRNVENVAE